MKAENPKVLDAPRDTFYVRHAKRILDFILALAGLSITAPLIALCGFAICWESDGPVFFRQTRTGRHGKSFQIFKFRTMVDKADQKGLKITASGDPRITRVGNWLRKTKIDEVPQLFNVLRGEMSLVGPRPEVPEYVATYNIDQRKVLELRPGLTGPASLAFIDEEKILAGSSDKVNFYATTLMVRKLELDLGYCEKVGFLEDLQLIMLTLKRLLSLPPRSKASES